MQITKNKPLKEIIQYTYISSSATVLRWTIDFSSLNLEESISFPLEKLMFPRWRIAATTLKIASLRSERD
jgi:hypothetical protein